MTVRPSVRTEKLGSHWTVFHSSILYLCVSRISVERIQCSLKSDTSNGYFTCRPMSIFDHISFSSSSNGKCFRDVVEKLDTHILCSMTFSANNAVYEIMRRNFVVTGRPHIIRWRMGIAFRIPKNIHTGCVILSAFPLQQRLHESASMLRYTYIGCLVMFY